MTVAVARFKVADYARWKESFATGAAMRKASGSRGAQVFQSVSDPNEVILLIEWDDLSAGMRLGQSPAIQELQKQGGILTAMEPYREADRFES